VAPRLTSSTLRLNRQSRLTLQRRPASRAPPARRWCSASLHTVSRPTLEAVPRRCRQRRRCYCCLLGRRRRQRLCHCQARRLRGRLMTQRSCRLTSTAQASRCSRSGAWSTVQAAALPVQHPAASWAFARPSHRRPPPPRPPPRPRKRRTPCPLLPPRRLALPSRCARPPVRRPRVRQRHRSASESARSVASALTRSPIVCLSLSWPRPQASAAPLLTPRLALQLLQRRTWSRETRSWPRPPQRSSRSLHSRARLSQLTRSAASHHVTCSKPVAARGPAVTRTGWSWQEVRQGRLATMTSHLPAGYRRNHCRPQRLPLKPPRLSPTPPRLSRGAAAGACRRSCSCGDHRRSLTAAAGWRGLRPVLPGKRVTTQARRTLARLPRMALRVAAVAADGC